MKTKFINSFFSLAMASFLLFLVGCKKEDLGGSVSLNTKTKDGGQPPFPLGNPDWTYLTTMPTPPGYPVTIYPPWGNGAVKGFNSDIWYDIYPTDGWSLVYNVFTDKQALPANPYFKYEQ